MPFKLSVIYGSVRTERKGIRAAKFIVKQLTEAGFDVTLIDPVEKPLPLLDKMYKEYEEGKAPEVMEELAATLKNSDGYVVVTGEYNHGIPPALKNLLDHFQKEYFFKPSGIMCYSAGRFGGVRAAIQLRSVLGELGTPSIPSILPVPLIGKNISEDGSTEDEVILKQSGKFIKELEWYVKALAKAREDGTPY